MATSSALLTGPEPRLGSSEQVIYLIECIFYGLKGVGSRQFAFVERDSNDTDYATTIRDIIEGQVENVVRVIEVNPAEFTSRDVTEDVVQAIVARLAAECEPCPSHLRDLVDEHCGASTADRIDYRAGVQEAV